MIMEFETDPVNFTVNEPKEDGTPWYVWHVRWDGKIGVDLTSVTSAQAFFSGSTQNHTAILIGDSHHWRAIKCDYSHFMMLWREAKRTAAA